MLVSGACLPETVLHSGIAHIVLAQTAYVYALVNLDNSGIKYHTTSTVISPTVTIFLLLHIIFCD
jgi:hypothetical protein